MAGQINTVVVYCVALVAESRSLDAAQLAYDACTNDPTGQLASCGLIDPVGVGAADGEHTQAGELQFPAYVNVVDRHTQRHCARRHVCLPA
jgi:hypothetical protein